MTDMKMQDVTLQDMDKLRSSRSMLSIALLLCSLLLRDASTSNEDDADDQRLST